MTRALELLDGVRAAGRERMKAFASPASPTPPRNSETLKVFVGGGLDNVVGRNTQGLYKQYLDSGTGPAEYYTHLSVPSIVGAIRRANEDGIPVDLIGHSYGAMAAFNAANLAGQRGYHVRNLVTADPVGRLSTSEGPLPPGRVGRWVNISADPPDETLGERLNLSDVVALIGGKPSGIPTATRTRTSPSGDITRIWPAWWRMLASTP